MWAWEGVPGEDVVGDLWRRPVGVQRERQELLGDPVDECVDEWRIL